MTRDEAIKIVAKGSDGSTRPLSFDCGGFVECLEALGVLKLDKPVPIRERVWAALQPVRRTFTSPDEIEKLLNEAGLKVVEK